MKQPKKVSDIIKHLEKGGKVLYHRGTHDKVLYSTIRGLMLHRASCAEYLSKFELLKPTKKITLYAYISEAGYLRHNVSGDSIAKTGGLKRVPELDRTVEVEA